MTTATLINRREMSDENWLALRRGGIGGSDVAPILGLSPWKTAMDVWLEKTGEFSIEQQDENEKMYWGTVLEDVVAQEFSRRTGYKVRRKNSILKSKSYSFMIANVDRMLVGYEAGLECKTAGPHSAKDWERGVPVYYMPQIQHYMAVTDMPVWFVAVLIGGQEFRYFRVNMDAEYIQHMIRVEEEFWGLVKTKTPPLLDGTKASTEAVKRLYPVAEKDSEIELPFEAFALIQQYEQASAEEKHVQLRKDEAANRLKDMLGMAERGSIHGRRVIWQNVTTTRFDSKLLQKDHPDMYEFYATKETYRRFSIK